MLQRKVSIYWLLIVMSSISVLIISGFVYYNLIFRNSYQIELPVKGIEQNPPSFLFNIEGVKNSEYLSNPLAVTATRDKVYVADTQNNRVSVYNKKGKFLFNFGQFGVNDGEFNYPNTIAVDKKENIYVGEFQNQRIQVFSAEGKYLRTISSDHQRKIFPLGITIKDEKIYVVNRTSEILIIDLSGKLIKKFGKPGTGEGLLHFPNGIAVSDKKEIFVSDSGNSRVQIFSDDGKYLKTLNSKKNPLNLPRGLTFDDFGRLYIVDTFTHSISVYDEDLNYLFSFGKRGIGKGEFNFPNDIFLDDEFRIFITDRENNRVVSFSYQ